MENDSWHMHEFKCRGCGIKLVAVMRASTGGGIGGDTAECPVCHRKQWDGEEPFPMAVIRVDVLD